MQIEERLGLKSLSKAALMAALRKIRVIYGTQGEEEKGVKEEELYKGRMKEEKVMSLKSFHPTPRDENGLEYIVIMCDGRLTRSFGKWKESKVNRAPFHFSWGESSDYVKMKREQEVEKIC